MIKRVINSDFQLLKPTIFANDHLIPFIDIMVVEKLIRNTNLLLRVVLILQGDDRHDRAILCTLFTAIANVFINP